MRSPITPYTSGRGTNVSFFHIRCENIYLVAVTKQNSNAALVFEFLFRVQNIAKSYFGVFEEETVKNNFVLIYELLDEIIDFGYPQNSDPDTLKLYITTESFREESSTVSVLS